MAMFNYAGPRFDFAPLAGLLDPIIEGVERQRQEKLRLAALAPDTPVAPAASVSTGGTPSFAGGRAKMAMPADPETERKFIDTVRSGGLTNPIAVAAIAAHVNAESGFNPANFTRTWSDPSESGKPGTSGGALSWRGDRLTKMLQATQGQDPAVAQAKYALLENPDMTVALQNAKSLEEAHSILANSQRYAGYNRPGGENARRLALAQNYYSRLGGGSDTATAEARPTAPVATASIQSPAVSPQKLAALRELAVRGSPADRQWAQNEITRLTALQKPVSIGNGILVDPRDPTKVVADYSDRTKPPDDYRKYQMEQRDPGYRAQKERERQHALEVAKAGGGITDDGHKYGPPEAGKVWKRTPEGKIAIDDRGAPIAIPYQGSRAYQEAEEAKTSKLTKEATAEVTRTILSDDIDRSLETIQNADIPVTGFMGWLAQGIPGTSAHILQQNLVGIKSNIGFGELQKMREASPTGGALGSVTIGEHLLLQSVYGSLEQSQGKGELIYNLKRLKKIQEDIINRGLKPEEIKQRLQEWRVSNREAKAAGVLDEKGKPNPATLQNISPEAIQALQANPNLKSQFDAKYGKGAADRYLKEGGAL